MSIHNRHAELFGDQDFQAGALRLLPVRQQGDHSAQAQASQVVGHVVGPIRTFDHAVFRGILDHVASGAQISGHLVERGKVEVFEAGHGPGQVQAVGAGSG